jgi:oligoendopeptidase F
MCTPKRLRGDSMNLNFSRLTTITDRNQWKQVYEEEICKLDSLYQEEERLYYALYAGEEPSERLEEIQQTKHRLMTDSALKEMMTNWKEKLYDDRIWQRRLSVFLSKMEQEGLDSHPELTRLQQELQESLLGCSFEVDGKSYNLGSVHSTIMDHPDRTLRERLMQEAKKIGRNHEELFRKMIKKRNELARKAGCENYYHFCCSLKGIDIGQYMSEMDILLKNTKDAAGYWDKRIKEKFSWETINHYDHYFSIFQFNEIDPSIFSSVSIHSVMKDILAGIGISDKSVPFKLETLEIPYGGFCINISPQEIKLVVNKRESYSVYLSGIHEMGHAVDGHYSSFEYPELYRFYSSIAAEGVAELFQTIVSDEEFLQKNFNIDKTIVGQMQEINKVTEMKMVRINHYYALVEYKMYANPEGDFQEMADDCYLRVFGEEGEAFHPASEMFYVENPAFFQDYNYALAIRDMIRQRYGIVSPYNQAEFFQKLLTSFIHPNQQYTWQERVRMLCGADFTFGCLAETLKGIEVTR